MRNNVPCEFPAGVRWRGHSRSASAGSRPGVGRVDTRLGLVRSLQLRSGHASVALRLPTSWCAVNFAYLWQRIFAVPSSWWRASPGDRPVSATTVLPKRSRRAVNDGRPFSDAFPGEGAGSLAALRLTFLRKGFLSRQQRLLRELREAGCSPAVICALRLGEVSVEDDTILIRQPGCAPVKGGAAEILQRYLERLAELGLDCSLAAPLIVDLEGEALSAERLLVHYETARTIRPLQWRPMVHSAGPC